MAQGLPIFPNYRETFGTSLPVVTALMAAISAAILVVPLSVAGSPDHLGHLPWTPFQMAVVTGSVAAALFIGTTMAALFAHAKDIDRLTQAQMGELFAGRIDQDEQCANCRTLRDRYYEWARVLWVSGVTSFLLTLGLVAYSKVTYELPVTAAIAGLAAATNFRGTKVVGKMAGVVGLASCMAVLLAYFGVWFALTIMDHGTMILSVHF